METGKVINFKQVVKSLRCSVGSVARLLIIALLNEARNYKHKVLKKHGYYVIDSS